MLRPKLRDLTVVAGETRPIRPGDYGGQADGTRATEARGISDIYHGCGPVIWNLGFSLASVDSGLCRPMRTFHSDLMTEPTYHGGPAGDSAPPDCIRCTMRKELCEVWHGLGADVPSLQTPSSHVF
eukprot:gene16380-biopygen4612